MSDDVTLTVPEYLRVIPRTKPVPELILDEIQRLIAAGILKTGDRLPSESELAERFGVGRSSLYIGVCGATKSRTGQPVHG
jgi:hypothetical protein